MDMIPLFKLASLNNDSMSSLIQRYYAITKKKGDCISRDYFVEHYNSDRQKKLEWSYIMNEVKRLGIEYARTRRLNGDRGCLVGLVRLEMD